MKILFFSGYPKLGKFVVKDREYFLRILNTDVPLQILVDNIKSDIFWKRSYSSRWSDSPIISNGRRWINVYLERHYADILENMNPRHYDPEKVFAFPVIVIKGRSEYFTLNC